MRGLRKTAGAALLAVAATLAAAAPAAAEFGPAQLISSGTAQPADSAAAPALSADGRYLAFEGKLAGFEGVFRRDLASGVIVRVAGVDAYDPEHAARRALYPSISAHGRYVSFVTQAPLDAANDLGAKTSDVYVADLASSPPSYELASARDGCDPGAATGCGLAYGADAGSQAARRVALSADGRRVAFVTRAVSDLGGEAGDTPAGQVLVRDLDADRTTLASARLDPESGEPTELPVPGGAVLDDGKASGEQAIEPGAALSADGTTVAWLGAHLPAQVPMPASEAAAIEAADATINTYDEPLWRRVADGPLTPTRRVVAGDDDGDPFPGMLGKDTELSSNRGWLGVPVQGVPALSADGTTVALIGNPVAATNVFLVEMTPGLSRAAAVAQLTREVEVPSANLAETINRPPHILQNGHVFDLTISADGRRLAFATARQQFPISPPSLVGTPPSGPGLVEVYLLDRDAQTLRRVSHGVGGDGEPSLDPTEALVEDAASSGAGAGDPSLAGDLIAFASTATNLVAADSNEASDVFLVAESEEARIPAASEIFAPEATRRRPKRWRLRLSSSSLPGGAVRIVAVVPAAGQVGVRARPEPGGKLSAKRLGRARRKARDSGRVKIVLRLPKRLRRMAHTREGVYATARVVFRHRGRKTLRGRVQVRFRARAAKRRAAR